MHVVVNAAMSADGKLSSRYREQIRISGEADFDRMDALRAASDAVVVGVGTVLADDPHLTVKDDKRRQRRLEAGKSPSPARVVVDSRGRIPPEAAVIDDAAETYVCVTQDAPTENVDGLAEHATVVPAGTGSVDLPEAFAALESAGLESIMVEGGGELIFSLVETDLVDELRVFVGPRIIGGRDAPTLADGEGFVGDFPELALEDVKRLDGGVVLSWRLDSDAAV
ncbi:2,5-diamino-6-(ribosylamino)-4(3H)-pyrimidinone 5'-phosphate reductase [Natronosalvus halobius]|uniref:2,5-diamino-6-(ribosylamino)-4(3H)-pyrimidinone 5'-phosphate reductase n=1 Tax=Natronosalvus halobius TaxID=2953746 RepID=UPI0020A18787|nr:2,5-diamino-6-(ribosylamino)-4(3H)-pyrimidinone 5'-phosphate reductase [Natronosalvus halobius]USZ72460.1 2,5-diamino-6-(ribosylamino)-4(3H)-pyrimidinone 5'-phosphate reductase [Natronosalvus halobius]